MTMIELKNHFKMFTTANGERIQAIKDVSLAIHEHEFISIIGPMRLWQIHIAANRK